MRRLLLICLALALAGAATAAAARQRQAAPPPLQAALETCARGAVPAERFAVFTGSMPAVPGAATLAMRFDLFERRAGGRFERVSLARWGEWEQSTRAGVAGFIFHKRVEQLAAPAAFRARVTFRWFDKAGAVIRSARRTSRSCRQPDPRPDLVARHLAAVRLDAQRARYFLLVRNRGRSDAAGSVATVAGVQVAVPALPAGEAVQVRATAPACSLDDRTTVVVDAAGAVDEAREGNDVRRYRCPLDG